MRVEGAAGAEGPSSRPCAGRSRCRPSTRSARSPSKIRAKTGSPGSTVAAVRRSTSAHGSEEVTRVLSTYGDSCAARAAARDVTKASQGRAAGRQCQHARSLPGDLGRQRLEPALDGPSDDRVPRVRVVAHSGGRSRRSIVSAALQEKSRAPSGSPGGRRVVLDEPGSRHELERQLRQLLAPPRRARPAPGPVRGTS